MDKPTFLIHTQNQVEFIPASFLEDHRMWELVIAVIEELPERYAHYLLLRYFQDFSYQEMQYVADEPLISLVEGVNDALRMLKEGLEARLGISLRYYLYPKHEVPVLTRIFEMDADALVWEEICRLLLEKRFENLK